MNLCAYAEFSSTLHLDSFLENKSKQIRLLEIIIPLGKTAKRLSTPFSCVYCVETISTKDIFPLNIACYFIYLYYY